MTQDMIIPILVAAAPTLAAVVGALINWNKSESIHIIVNNQRTLMEQHIEDLRKEVEGLKSTIVALQKMP